MSPTYLNLSGYRFAPLDGLAALRQRIFDSASAAGLKGTVLLAEEGINLFVAGVPDAARAWLDALRSDPRFAALEAKESFSEQLPFRRLKVKVKREIIRMNQPQVRPAAGRRCNWLTRSGSALSTAACARAESSSVQETW